MESPKPGLRESGVAPKAMAGESDEIFGACLERILIRIVSANGIQLLLFLLISRRQSPGDYFMQLRGQGLQDIGGSVTRLALAEQQAKTYIHPPNRIPSRVADLKRLSVLAL